MSTIDYTARLHSTTADGILAHTSELYDTEESKFQSAINKEVGNKLTELEQNIGSKISGVYKVKGTKATIAEVLKEPLTKGDVWNIESEFTLKGKKYPAGTNVVAINTTQVEDSLDPLGGTVDVQDILNKAAADATTKANNAKQQAIETASTDATNKAGTAKSEAIEAAASDATSKADAAKEAAITAAAKDADSKAAAAKQDAIDDAEKKYVPKKGTDRLITEAEAKEIRKATQLKGAVVEFDDSVFSGEILTSGVTGSGDVVWHLTEKRFCYRVGNSLSYKLYDFNWPGRDENFPPFGCLKTIYRNKKSGLFYIGTETSDGVPTGQDLVAFQALNDIVAKAHTESEKKADKTSVYTKSEADNITNPIKEKATSALSTAEDANKKVTALQEKVTALENLLKLA